MKFASLRHQISHFVHEAREPLSKAQLREICDMAEDDAALSNALFQMSAEGMLTRHPAPEGSGVGVRWCYGPGKVKPGAEPPENDAGGGDSKAGRSGGRESGKSKRRAKHAKRRHKVQRRTAKRAARRITPIAPPNPRGDPMWALLADGAFVLLGTDIEIPAHQARALVEFIRTLDKGQA